MLQSYSQHLSNSICKQINESSYAEEEAVQPPPLLKTFEDMLHNRIAKKKAEIYRTQNGADITDRVWTEIETLQWVFIRRLLTGHESKLQYY
jgi:hypothetical protein